MNSIIRFLVSVIFFLLSGLLAVPSIANAQMIVAPSIEATRYEVGATLGQGTDPFHSLRRFGLGAEVGYSTQVDLETGEKTNTLSAMPTLAVRLSNREIEREKPTLWFHAKGGVATRQNVVTVGYAAQQGNFYGGLNPNLGEIAQSDGKLELEGSVQWRGVNAGVYTASTGDWRTPGNWDHRIGAQVELRHDSGGVRGGIEYDPWSNSATPFVGGQLHF